MSSKHTLARVNISKGQYHQLVHCNDTDARFVEDIDGNKLAQVSSNMFVAVQDEAVGRIAPVKTDKGAHWAYVPRDGTDMFVTKQPVDNYNWRTLMKAEVEIFEHLLG